MLQTDSFIKLIISNVEVATKHQPQSEAETLWIIKNPKIPTTSINPAEKCAVQKLNSNTKSVIIPMHKRNARVVMDYSRIQAKNKIKSVLESKRESHYDAF